MLKCDFCFTEWLHRVKSVGDGLFSCDKCLCPTMKSGGFSVGETVFFPSLGNVSKARVREMERRVILPYEKKDGGYYLGRKGENGKVQERAPNYYP